MTEEKEVLKKEKPRCKKCGSGFVYVRLKTNTLCCRTCGHKEVNK